MFIIPSKFNSGTKKTASRELDLHQQSFLNPTDEIQRYPTDSALQPAPSGRTAFTAPDFHDRVHTDRNKLNPVIMGSWTFPDIQIRNADLHQERHLTRRPCRSSRTAAMPTARPTFPSSAVLSKDGNSRSTTRLRLLLRSNGTASVRTGQMPLPRREPIRYWPTPRSARMPIPVILFLMMPEKSSTQERRRSRPPSSSAWISVT